MRVKSEKPCDGGGWLHPRAADSLNLPIPPRPKRPSDAELRDRWTPIAMLAAKTGFDKLPALAVQLGVTTESLALLNVGYSEDMQQWTFPERNAQGWIVGLTRRLPSGRKLFCKGSRRGLTFCDGWEKYPGCVWLVEGASDVAAAISIGLCVVGRPNNIGGIGELVKLISPHAKRKIIVLGERDKRRIPANGDLPHDPKCRCCPRCWPGKSGMIQTAQALAAKLGRYVATMMPPAHYKDLRELIRTLDLTSRAEYATKARAGILAAPHKPNLSANS